LHAELQRLFEHARSVEDAVWSGKLAPSQALAVVESFRTLDAARVQWVLYPLNGVLATHVVRHDGMMVPAEPSLFVEHPPAGLAVWAKMVRAPRGPHSVSLRAGLALVVFCLMLFQLLPRPETDAAASAIHRLTPEQVGVSCIGPCREAVRVVRFNDDRVGSERTATTFCRAALAGKHGELVSSEAAEGIISCRLDPCPTETTNLVKGGPISCVVSR
jgi:hypothetical protein